MPLHLEDHLDSAIIQGSEVPADLPRPVEWRFDEPQPDWQPADPISPQMAAVRSVRSEDALQLSLIAEAHANGTRLVGNIYAALAGWTLEDWAYVEIRARTRDRMDQVGLNFNYDQGDSVGVFRLTRGGDWAPLVTDGTVQTYRMSLDSPRMERWEGPWTHLGIWFTSRPDEEAATLDLLSVRVIPREAEFAEDRTGVRPVRSGAFAGYGPLRRALYLHAPGRIAFRVRIPEAGRLDAGLGVLRGDAPVTFAITATRQGGAVERVFEETYAGQKHWAQRSVDLSHLAGQTVTLALEAEAPRSGTVALWAAPTLSGSTATDKPNIIFYVIDGAGADYMSVYGYNRRTTPNLERLAAEGALFERAYSNSSWTRPSTASFMTSLQHSVLGGFTSGFNVIPEEARTMAQHLHGAGYQTAVLTANPNAGRLSGLERGVDFFREAWAEFTYAGGGNYRESSRYLHEAFWGWREAYPSEPYWVHFQSVDIHEDFPASAPFGGLFVGPERVRRWREWDQRLNEEGGHGEYSEAWERTGLSRVGFFTLQQALYDETMAHNDYQIGRLVERLKAEGEWGNTLLIVGSDHSIEAAMDDMGIAIQDSLPPRWSRAMFRSSISRIPLIFVWPGHIVGGQRFSQPVVSMIDVLPTILDLVGLPLPEVMQGQSLAPVLLGEEGWVSRPVILDEFAVDLETGERRGLIEVVDGRWGASMEINPEHAGEEEEALWRRPVPLLLYDLWNDPFCLHSLHEERPDLVDKYTAFLEAQWEAHQALGQRFTPGEPAELTPEQLETLRALGYIR
jgi:arylsulfatase A-like enzyme